MQTEKARKRVEQETRKQEEKLGVRLRPTLEEWMVAAWVARSGPFLLDVVTAGAILPTAYTKWRCGVLDGPEPDVIRIGRILKKMGCKTWWVHTTKAWILPRRDEIAACYKGGSYWERRIRHVAAGGDPAWEPEPLDRTKNREPYMKKFHSDKVAAPEPLPSWY